MTPQKPVSQIVRKSAVVLLISVVVGLLFFAATHSSIPFSVKDRGAVLSLKRVSHIIPDLYELLERNSLYLRYQARSRKFREPLNPHIAIIGIDTETLKDDALPQIFWYKRYFPVMKMLVENGVTVIGLDDVQSILVEDAVKLVVDDEFISKARKSLKERIGSKAYHKADFDEWTSSLVEKIPVVDKEKELRMLYLSSQKVVLPATLKLKPGSSNYYIIALKPVDQIHHAAGDANLAIVNLPTEEEDVVFKHQIIYQWDREGELKAIKSFSMRIAEKYLDKTAEEKDNGQVLFNGNTIPLDAERQMIINYRKPVDYVNDVKETGSCLPVYYSFKDVLKKAEAGDSKFFSHHFMNRIVLIGLVLPSHDVFRTPIGKDHLMPGVEVHAHVIRTLLDGDYMARAGNGANLLALLVLSIIAGFITYRCKPLTAVIICLSLVGLYLFIMYGVFFNHYKIWVDFAHILCVVFVFGAVYSYKYIDEERERQQVRKIFGRYVSKSVMETILSNPKNLALGGSRRKVTVLFSDINNFTPHSEKLTPEELMIHINNYFNEMNAIILKYNGTIKQFVGDEIMVLYGAPMDQEDQAVLAVNSALEMVDRLNELRSLDPTGEKGFYEVKIGIHTGDAVAGNVGSKDRTEYACVGDNVNMTARIEGLNKKLGTTILISEDTYNEVKDRISNAEFISFEPQEVKGKKKRINVFEVRRPQKGGSVS